MLTDNEVVEVVRLTLFNERVIYKTIYLVAAVEIIDAENHAIMVYSIYLVEHVVYHVVLPLTVVSRIKETEAIKVHCKTVIDTKIDPHCTVERSS